MIQNERIEEWPKSKEAWERAKKSLSGGVSTGLRAKSKPHPIYFHGGKGAILDDFDGHQYYDYVSGWGPNILGHGHPDIVEAVTKQIPLGATYGSSHKYEYEVAELLLDCFPGMERVLWSNTGTEADLSALRIARAATGKNHFLKFTGAYHGWSDPMLIGYRATSEESDPQLESKGQLPAVLEDLNLVPWGDLEAARAVVENRDDIAAIFLEPVLNNSGVLEPPVGFLEGLRQLCDEHGILLIFDEVITGLRIAQGGAVEKYGVIPDMVVLAKALAGGLSLSAILGKAELLDLTIQGVVHAGTYNGNPLVLSAAQATINRLRQPGTYETFERLGSMLAQGLRDQMKAHGVVGAVNQVGPVVQVALDVTEINNFQDYIGSNHAKYDELLVAMLRYGLFGVPGGRWYLSTEHTEEIVEDSIRRFGLALEEIK